MLFSTLDWLLYTIFILCIGSYAAAFTVRWPIKNNYLWEKEAHTFLSLPFHQKPPDSLNSRRSFCLQCHHFLNWKDLVPLLSYLFLKGRCRYCQSKISVRYFVIESLHLLVCLPLLFFFQDPYLLILHTLLISALLSSAVIDSEHQLIPDECSTFTLACALLINLSSNTLENSVLGMIVGYAVICAIRAFYLSYRKQEGIGLGDAKIIAALGAWIGIEGLAPMLLCASLSGILYTLLINKNWSNYLAFGPFLIFSSLLVFYFNL